MIQSQSTFPPVVSQRPFIFDVGCHNGQDSDFFLRKGFTVLGVEANPVLCAELRRRFSQQIGEGRFILVDRAIAEQSGEVEFFMNLKSSIWGTIRDDVAKRHSPAGADLKRVMVPSVQFSSLLTEYGTPYYLKIDIEGADVLCLRGLLAHHERPQFASIENSQSSWRELAEEFSLLTKLGYTRFQIVDQAKVPNQSPPCPAREGVYVDQRFDLGATGLFGRELPGTWLTRRRALVEYSKIYARNKLTGLAKKISPVNAIVSRFQGSWYDTHATF
jgi:FkbM family methyltransferase